MTEAHQLEQDALLPNVIRLALSDAFHNKDILPPNTKAAYGNSFISQDIQPSALIAHVTSGKAFTMGAFSDGRTKETFTSGQVFGLDLDNNVSMEDCLSFDFIRQYAYLIYPTPSSGKPDNDGNIIHKSRVLFIADAPVPDRAVWERLQRALMWHCNILSPDDACKDAARLFFGSQTDEYHTQSVVLPVAILETLATQMEAEIGKQQAERTIEDNNRIREQNQRNLADDKAKQRLYNYAASALDTMVSELSRMSADSGRNKTLYKFGAKAGNYVSAGMISYSECESALRGAALSSGLPSHEIDSTLPRAISAGLSSPVDTDALEKAWAQKVADWKKQRQARVISIQEVYEQQKAALPEKPKTETVTDEDVIQLLNMELEGRLQTTAKNWLVYNDGYFMSWWKDKHVPLSVISAMLNLTETRSSTAWVLIAMHQCMIEGHLSWALFSVADVVNATGLNRALVKKAFVELERGGYVRFLKTDSLYNIIHTLKDTSQETVHNLSQHKADYYTPLLDIQTIRTSLLKMLKRRFTEKYGKRGMVTPNREMAAQMGIEDKADYDAWVQRFEAARTNDDMTGEAARRLKQEFEGDGHNWNGWEYALRNDYALPVDWKACESIKDVRGQILKQFIALPRRDVNSQIELCRLLGCSSATLSDVMRSQNIATIEQTETIEYRAAAVDNLDMVIREIRRDKRGMVRMVWFREKGETSWLRQHVPQASLMYARNRKRIHEVSLQIVTPSKQKVMTPEEIEAVYTIREKIDEVKAILKSGDLSDTDTLGVKDVLKRAKKAARAARMKVIPKLIKELDSIIEQHGIAEVESVVPVKSEPKEKRERREPKVTHEDNPRIWYQYNPKTLYKQLHKQVFMFTDYQLVGNVVMDNDKNTIFKADNHDLSLINRWLRPYTTLKRNSYDYHGIDYKDFTPEIRALIKEYYKEQQKALYDNLENDSIPEGKVIQMTLDSANKSRQERYPLTKWVGRYGLVNEIRGNDLYVDGFRQVMSDRTWQGVEQEIQEIVSKKDSIGRTA